MVSFCILSSGPNLYSQFFIIHGCQLERNILFSSFSPSKIHNPRDPIVTLNTFSSFNTFFTMHFKLSCRVSRCIKRFRNTLFILLDLAKICSPPLLPHLPLVAMGKLNQQEEKCRGELREKCCCKCPRFLFFQLQVSENSPRLFQHTLSSSFQNHVLSVTWHSYMTVLPNKKLFKQSDSQVISAMLCS